MFGVRGEEEEEANAMSKMTHDRWWRGDAERQRSRPTVPCIGSCGYDALPVRSDQKAASWLY